MSEQKKALNIDSFFYANWMKILKFMPRPQKPRRILFEPNVTYFKPRAVPLSMLEEVDLEVDELEAIRLCDFENLDQVKAAKKMGISQSTLGRILSSAHKKIAEALVDGKAIKIKKTTSY